MKMKRIPLVMACAMLVSLTAPMLEAASVVVPYDAPIDSTTVGEDLADVVHGGVSANWSVQEAGSNIYQYTTGATTGTSTALWSTSNLDGTTTVDWSVSAVFTLNDVSADAYIGLYALGAGTNSTAFTADVRNNTMRIIALNPTTSISTGTFTGIDLNSAAAIGITFTATLSGTYTDDTLTSLSFSLSDGTVSKTISGAPGGITPTASNVYFGVRNNTTTTGDTLGIQYQSIEITSVPEPSESAIILGLLAIGIAAFVRRRIR